MPGNPGPMYSMRLIKFIRRLREIAVVAGDLPIEQNVFRSGSGADVVNDQKMFRRFRDQVTDNANMRYASAKVPSHDITWQIIIPGCRRGDSLALTLEKSHEVQHAPMIDVAIRSRISPAPWVRRPGGTHVFVNFLLQIDSGLAKCADDDVRTNASLLRHIAARVIKTDVSRIIAGRNPSLFNSAGKHGF